MGSLNTDCTSVNSSKNLNSRRRTSSPTRNPESSTRNFEFEDENYEEFKSQLQNQPAESNLVGLTCPNETFISGHLTLSTEEDDFTYIMVFPGEFDSVEFEFIEVERKLIFDCTTIAIENSCQELHSTSLPNKGFRTVEAAFNKAYISVYVSEYDMINAMSHMSLNISLD